MNMTFTEALEYQSEFCGVDARVSSTNIELIEDERAPMGWRVQLAEPYRERFDILIEEFEKFDAGYVHMQHWFVFDDPTTTFISGDYLNSAMENPCGTAACIAGKAGLMERFQGMGFGFSTDSPNSGFDRHCVQFFGKVVRDFIFMGDFAMNHIKTPQQAVLLMKALRDDMRDGILTVLGIPPIAPSAWRPRSSVINHIDAIAPSDWKDIEEKFPVSAAHAGGTLSECTN